METVEIPKELYDIMIEIVSEWIKDRKKTYYFTWPDTVYTDDDGYTIKPLTNERKIYHDKVSDYPPAPQPTC